MTDTGIALVSLIALILIGRLAFRDARKADDDEKKLWP
jgi:hypothetical protein